MNYEDELERAQARKSRKRQNQKPYHADSQRSYPQDERDDSYGENLRSESRHSARQMDHRASREDERWAGMAEPGSRASRINGAGSPHRKKKPGKRGRKLFLGILIGLLVLVAVVVGAVYAYIRGQFKLADKNEFNKEDVQNTEIDLAVREKMEKGYWTIAVFGLDSRDSSTGAGNQSDVIMIVNINRETGEIKLASVFRDTYLNVNDRNTYNKINAAYAEGGPEQAVKALNKNLDLNITQYASFNWKAVATAINILDGVDIDISKSEFYYINSFITETVKGTGIGSVHLKQAGLNHLDGVQAVAYGRLRLMDTDYARTERQRIIIQKAFEKAKVADLATLNSLVGNMFEMCSTNINELDVLRMAKDVKKYHLGESMGFPAARDEQKIKIGSRRADCVIPQTLVSNVKSLHKFLFDTDDYTPTSTVQTISKKISDVSGLYNAGKEIDHVATDQGYVPKNKTSSGNSNSGSTTKTTEATSEEDENEESESSTGETSSGDMTATLPGESTTVHPGGSNGGMGQTDVNGNPTAPTTGAGLPTSPTHSDPYVPTTSENDRPKSPADMATMPTTEGFGPGSEPTTSRIPEATTSGMSPVPTTSATNPANTNPGNAPTAATTPTSGSSVIISPTTNAHENPPLTPGNINGPADAATSPN